MYFLSFSKFLFAQEIVPKPGDTTIIINDNQKNGLNIIDLILQKNKPAKSIMLTQEESDKVEEAIESFKNNKPLKGAQEEVKEEAKEDETNKNQPKEQSRLYLDAILYLTKNNWIAWINGTKISAEDNDPTNAIYITQIDSNKAKIRWKMGISKWKVLTGLADIDETIYPINKQTNQVELNFILRTNQTYNLSDNKITEGKFGKQAPDPKPAP